MSMISKHYLFSHILLPKLSITTRFDARLEKLGSQSVHLKGDEGGFNVPTT